LKELEGIVDIYMPDFKYWDDKNAISYSGAFDYREVACSALLEMHRQVGDLEVDEEGIAIRGLIIRHLVLPNNIAGTSSVLEFIARRISQNSYVNIMNQYRPCFQAWRRPELDRIITTNEYNDAIGKATELGLHRGF
jgi:putative pyruvate formate lyase activating enzyme